MLRGTGLPRPLWASIAHSRRLVAIALAPDPVGIDVEWPQRRDFASIARFRWGAAAACNQAANFYRLWTIEEAFFKASGRRLPDRTLHRLLAARPVRRIAAAGQAWFIAHRTLASNAVLAVALAAPSDAVAETVAALRDSLCRVTP